MTIWFELCRNKNFMIVRTWMLYLCSNPNHFDRLKNSKKTNSKILVHYHVAWVRDIRWTFVNSRVRYGANCRFFVWIRVKMAGPSIFWDQLQIHPMKHPVSKVADILFKIKNSISVHWAKWPTIDLSIKLKMTIEMVQNGRPKWIWTLFKGSPVYQSKDFGVVDLIEKPRKIKMI